MKIQEKALRVIEGLTLEVASLDKLGDACYKFSHIALGRCENRHKDWREELDDTYDRLAKIGVI